MQYPLPEKIGCPELFVGREEEFQSLNRWLAKIPQRLGKSRALLARRKSGKTCLVQRIFNRLWSENGMVIPFYFVFEEHKIWLPDLAIKYYCTFASQYISFLERDVTQVRHPLTLKEIQEYGNTKTIKPFLDDVAFLLENRGPGGAHDLMWETAYSAPHRIAALFDQRVLVILDEFQYITRYVYRDQSGQGEPDNTLAGSYHNLSESKVAPLLITSSYPSWLMEILANYLEAGRVKPMDLSPYLSPAAGLEAVHRYAQWLGVEMTNETALQINELCFSDPFFISCVIDSECPNKDLTTADGVVEVVKYEISRKSEMARTWEEYLFLTLRQVNNQYAKSLLLFLHKHPNRYWTAKELKERLQIDDLTVAEIQQRLEVLSKADVIERGESNLQFRGLQDGTLHLIIRSRLEEEINDFVPDLKQEFHETIKNLHSANWRLRGQLNQLKGRVAEYWLAKAMRKRQRFVLSEFFQHVKDTTKLHLTLVQEQVRFQRIDGKEFELDVIATDQSGRVVLVEVKKTQEKMGVAVMEAFWEKVLVYQQNHPDAILLPAFLSLGGFTQEAEAFGEAHGIARAEELLGE